MDRFTYDAKGRLHCEGVPVDKIADEAGTPVYLYSQATFTDHLEKLHDAFAAASPLICYSIKSCGNIHLLRLLAERGAGMDVVSGGELHRALKAGVDPEKIVYAGVGKTNAEIIQALEAGIGYFNIESEAEFENIAAIAKRLNKTSRAALRVNPDVADPKTHAKTTTGKKETKFGVDLERARRFFDTYANDDSLKLTALHLHIGSPIYSPEPYVLAMDKALQLVDELRAAGHSVDTLDMGGGFAADYESGKSPDYAEYAAAMLPKLEGKGLKLIMEPGRTIAANAGILVCQVQYLKQGGSKNFVIVDTGMHHLLRPAMYDAFHFVWPTRVDPGHVPVRRAAEPELMGGADVIPDASAAKPASASALKDKLVLTKVDVVGPICETADTIAKDRPMPPVTRGDRLAIFTAGAYGMVMASNYNAMPRPAEVLVEGDAYRVIRRRETYDDLVAAEI